MHADVIATSLEESATVGYLVRCDRRRALWLKLSAGGLGLGLGWADLVVPRFDDVLAAWVVGTGPARIEAARLIERL